MICSETVYKAINVKTGYNAVIICFDVAEGSSFRIVEPILPSLLCIVFPIVRQVYRSYFLLISYERNVGELTGSWE